MMKIPSEIISSPRWLQCSVFLIIGIMPSLAVAAISYSDHCSYMVPEAPPTTPVFTVYPFLEPATSYYAGGKRILGNNINTSSTNSPLYGSRKSLYFAATKNIFKTNVDGLYKIEAHLTFDPHNYFYLPSNSTADGLRRSRLFSLDFFLRGFWSVSSQKLCMVGSAPWYSSEGKFLKLEAVLKLKFARNLTVHTSLVSGFLESLASSSNDPSYFEPISIFGFSRVTPRKYNYSLVSEEGCSSRVDIPPNSSLSLEATNVCAMFSMRFSTYKLKYTSECNSSQNCTTPFGTVTGELPSLVYLYAIQCTGRDKKLRYLVGFPPKRSGYHSSFDLSTTLVGEGVWDGKNNQLCIVLCKILNQNDPLGSAHVGDCSVRLSLRYFTVWSITSTFSVEGEIWSNKTANDVGYFERIKFQNSDDSMAFLPGMQYEYTAIEKVTKSCPVRFPFEKKGERYPDAHSFSMRFDLSIKHSKHNLGWGFADPLSVGHRFHDQYSTIITESRHGYAADGELVPVEDSIKDANSAPVVASATHYHGPLNISYEISFRPLTGVKWDVGISSLNGSSSTYGEVKIRAEGVYNDRTGYLCMVGCRRLISNDSFDCEILVKMQFPPSSGKNERGFIKGSIESTRNKYDPLHFERLDISSAATTIAEARRSIWRMDLEIIMVLISNTLACVFVGLQLLHVRKQLHVLPSISLFMLLILTLAHMIPLVLNFEALFTGHRGRQNVMLGSGGWLEVNEVFVRVVTMVAFILEFRLFQLALMAKFSDTNEKGSWIAETKTLFVALPLYIIGGSVALLVNGTRNKYSTMTRLTINVNQYQPSLWGSLRSYAGLVLDGFLFPQILLNVFQNSKGTALSPSFYIGTTFVSLVPHAYDLYRGHNYTGHQFDRLYVYANPRADFYSPLWDAIIPCGGILFVAIVAFQQHFGGRFFLPQRLRESGEYEMVPVVSSQ